jgi:hypothetical protein
LRTLEPTLLITPDFLDLPEDLGAYAEARVLARLAQDLVAPGCGQFLFGLATELTLHLADVLNESDPVAAVAALRAADATIDPLRGELYRLHTARTLPAASFDDLAKATARCRREIATLSARVRRRAWRRLQGSAP